MGDVVSLVERAQEQFDAEQARKINKKLPKINLVSMISYPKYNRLKKMGNMKDLVGMIPGVNKMMPDEEIDEDALNPLKP